MKQYCFGADIGGTTVKLGLFDQDGIVLDKWEIPTRTENEGIAILPDMAASIKEKIQEHGLHMEEIAGIGVDVPGPISEDGIVPHTANLGWGYKEVTRELTELTGLPSKAGNDANVAALGEMWLGGGKGHTNVLMITLGTGVGGGIVVNGKARLAIFMWMTRPRSAAAAAIRAAWSSSPPLPASRAWEERLWRLRISRPSCVERRCPPSWSLIP